MMLHLAEFEKNFGSLPIPDALLKLLAFQNALSGKGSYSQGFELMQIENEGVRTYSENQEFLSSLAEFAEADGTGSTYALWYNEPTKDPQNVPVVIFGSEGGYHVVAQNVVDLLRILTLDSEPMVDWERVSYYKDESNYIQSAFQNEYKEWMSNMFQFDPVQTIDHILQQAQDRYQSEFYSWLSKFIAD